jgi:hypothetical protein
MQEVLQGFSAACLIAFISLQGVLLGLSLTMGGHTGLLFLFSSEIPFFLLLSFRQLITSSVLSSQGVLLGMSNTAGVLAGVLGTAATGYILQNGK